MHWFKSEFSNEDQCVEHTMTEDGVLIRDSKEVATGAFESIRVSVHEWETFLCEIRGTMPRGANGELSTVDGPLAIRLFSRRTGQSLEFTQVEWDVFVRGVHEEALVRPSAYR